MRIVVVAVALFPPPPALAATAYPDKPIRMIVPVAPGGGADITARAVAQKLAAAWGQQIIIDNRAGAGGTVGMDIGAHATPDGYTVIEGSMGPLTVDVSLYSKLPYDPVRDFTPIARGVTALNMLVVHPSLPVNSVKELIAYAKANPARLNFGSSGAGRADHLAGELFNTLAGVKMQHVPYKGGAPAMVDLVGGNIQLIFATVSTAVASVKAGRIRPLAVTTANRVELFPELPTVAEAGVPGFAVDNWYGFVGPRGLPREIVLKLHGEINRALGAPDVKSRLEQLGILPFTLPTPEAFGDYIKAEIAKYAKVVKDSGVRVD
ncbi:MAG TPA: tripartite tricarboxylate transporter substrate binding protein [Burkholderiales bacterium]|nr:tripartite tricarboxylate transporter substrate binding protein [Burkholderiales bacterium]